MSARQPAERIEFGPAPDLPGVILARVTESSHAWRVHHETYTTSTILEGNGSWTYRGRPMDCGAPSVTIAEPGEFHRIDRIHSGTLSFRACLIAPAVFEAVALEAGYPRGSLRLASHQTDRPAFYRHMLDLHAALERPASALERQSFMTACVGSIVEHASEAAGTGRARFQESGPLQRVHGYLRDQLDRNVSLDELAALARLPKFTLLRAFSARYGLPPHACQIQMRIARAVESLTRGRPTAEVAVETGFSDQSHLTRCFRQSMGVTPGRFVRGLRGG